MKQRRTRAAQQRELSARCAAKEDLQPSVLEINHVCFPDCAH
jgi:hypothetical protein